MWQALPGGSIRQALASVPAAEGLSARTTGANSRAGLALLPVPASGRHTEPGRLPSHWSLPGEPRILRDMSRPPRSGPLLLALTALVACSHPAPPPPGPPAETPEQLLDTLLAAADELAARPEQALEQVTIQHLLVAVTGGGVPGANRSPGEAEEWTAQLFGRARAGEDFDLLVKNFTNETYPGVYTLTAGPDDPPRTFARSSVMPILGDVAWRLKVGELGVALYDGGLPGHEAKSPLGYHIVRRIE